jgi:acetamidase/formamidase
MRQGSRTAAAFAVVLAVASGAVHSIVNEVNYHTFSKDHPILLKIRPGDTIVTKTVDSAGFDAAGVRHTKTHGNPLTGPFYIEGAEPGDAVAVHLRRVRLNRTTGYTAFRVGALEAPARDKYSPGEYAEGAVLPGRKDLIPFAIDVKRGTARPKEKLSSRADLTFSAMPMLGCIGVAPADASPTSGPAGAYGGNLDYSEVREGSTVILPVYVPGAYLFLGDGHALQGDGEAVGSGIETSLDVEFTVELRKTAGVTEPRVESAEFLISIGARTATSRSLNDALTIATSDMMRWLVEGYGIEPVAAHLLIGHRAKYDVAALSGVVAIRIPKNALRTR